MHIMTCDFICRLEWCSLKKKKTCMYIMTKTCHWPLLYIGTCILKHVTHKCDTTLPEYDAAHPLCCRALQGVAGRCRVLQGVAGCCRVCCIVNIHACCCIHLVCCGLCFCLSTGVAFVNKFVYGVKKQCLLQVY